MNGDCCDIRLDGQPDDTTVVAWRDEGRSNYCIRVGGGIRGCLNLLRGGRPGVTAIAVLRVLLDLLGESPPGSSAWLALQHLEIALQHLDGRGMPDAPSDEHRVPPPVG